MAAYVLVRFCSVLPGSIHVPLLEINFRPSNSANFLPSAPAQD